ncbi:MULTISPECIES: MFS transporter [Mycobacteriaceae]|uniref:MFS transporter n=1 Tax=Mycolicibacterium neoaurum VKM Ac-1815D TaxID=700508 RepID=V5XED7_MYCNE|nr:MULTISPECIES: MFS transporter [Mycobacteriaceae]AHC25779.1 multidrug transporter [Mycolicibacterium neoaurum VKM Ac-1815D]AMO06199.1 multidrug transporter [Mycolicibacterium neoaurum]AXK75456.1 MFS transporter [Mycolicibacterium neoaurum]KJQ50304.1 multidrug transporter [Mycolicibacterium neoaurum]KUM09462.1 multidrug transporter [Mycolicibacterium neoaurum]
MSAVTERSATTGATAGPRRRTVGFAGLAIASFLGCVDLTIVTTALPSITGSLDSSLVVSQLVLSAFLTALAVFMVTAGRLGDLLGRKTVLVLGITVFVLASVGAALAPSISWLVVARFVQGAACAILYTGTTTLVETLFPEGSRGRAVGLLYAVNGVGLALGPVLGGLLVPAFGWPAIFWINVPFGIVALLAILAAVPSPARSRGLPLDLPGQAFLALAVGGLAAAASLPETTGWLSVPVAVAVLAVIIGVAGTVFVERRAAAPLIRLDLFRHPRFRAALTSDFLLAVFYASALLVLPPYLAFRHGLDVRTTGWVLLLVSATMALTSSRVGRWVDRSGPVRPLLTGFTAFTGTAVLVIVGTVLGSLPVLLVGLVTFGLGWALILAPATLAALSAVDPQEAGFAVGASWTFHNLGGALGAAVAAGLFATTDPQTGLLRVSVLLVMSAAVGLIANALIARGAER